MCSSWADLRIEKTNRVFLDNSQLEARRTQYTLVILFFVLVLQELLDSILVIGGDTVNIDLVAVIGNITMTMKVFYGRILSSNSISSDSLALVKTR